MKKLNLKMQGIGEMLSKEQMKNVTGGYDNEGPGWYKCCGLAGNIGCSSSVWVPAGSHCECKLGTCTKG